MACGKPVITYYTGGSIESVCDDTGFIIKKGDIDSLTDTLIKLGTNFKKNNFSKKCRLKAKKYFHHFQIGVKKKKFPNWKLVYILLKK